MDIIKNAKKLLSWNEIKSSEIERRTNVGYQIITRLRKNPEKIGEVKFKNVMSISDAYVEIIGEKGGPVYKQTKDLVERYLYKIFEGVLRNETGKYFHIFQGNKQAILEYLFGEKAGSLIDNDQDYYFGMEDIEDEIDDPRIRLWISGTSWGYKFKEIKDALQTIKQSEGAEKLIDPVSIEDYRKIQGLVNEIISAEATVAEQIGYFNGDWYVDKHENSAEYAQ